jgi:hypothetical protein
MEKTASNKIVRPKFHLLPSVHCSETGGGCTSRAACVLHMGAISVGSYQEEKRSGIMLLLKCFYLIMKSETTESKAKVASVPCGL